MTKQEAADALGVSTRQVENYVKQRRLTVSYGKSERARITVFDPAEVADLKKKLDAVNQTKEAIYHAPTPPESENLPALIDSKSGGAADLLAQLLAPLMEKKTIAPSAVSVADKLLLTLDEAQALTGLSRDTLRDAIKAEKLKAQIIGRGWRIKRLDLETYITEL